MRTFMLGCAAALGLSGLSVVAHAQEVASDNTVQSQREHDEAFKMFVQSPEGLVWEQRKWTATVGCTLYRPSQIQRYQVTCSGATFLDASIADCCISGDHWQVKHKNWDSSPNTAVTTSPGKAALFGAISRVYNYGGTASNPGNINAEVDCSYLHGVDVFPAGSTIALTSDGFCSVTPLDLRDAIDRAP